MSNIPENLRYSKDHEYVNVTGDVATLGITDYAQHNLGDVVYGWMVKVKMDNPGEADALLSGEEYEEYLSTGG